MTIGGRWTRLFVDAERCLVYGPRFGRLYLLTGAEALEASLRSLLGLRRWPLVERLDDPAVRVVLQRSDLNGDLSVRAPPFLRFAYLFLHHSRHILPFGLAARLIGRLVARRASPSPRTVDDIGRTVHAIECATGISDCYPRALITAWLCAASGLECELVVGSLAPTRKMHAWCCADGQIPYEASPEHYLYQPLAIWALTP